MSRSTDHCPSTEQWEAFLKELLSDIDTNRLSEHLSRCLTCQATLEHLTSDDLFDYRNESVVIQKRSLEEYLSVIERETNSTFPVLDGYEIVEEVGQGASGVVYKARQEVPFERTVAIKVIDGAFRGSEFRRRFEQEIKALASLSHPNIATIYDAGVLADGRPYLVMEFVEGRTLNEFCEFSRADLGTRLDLIRDTCEAMHYAHGQGVIHRDLKPTNILVSEVNGVYRAKVIDFGIAKIQISADAAKTGDQTVRGTVQGTYEYMSPEQARGEVSSQLDQRSDVYALGVMTFELLTSTTPLSIVMDVSESSVSEIVSAICNSPVTKPSRVVGELSSEAFERHLVSINLSREQLSEALSNDLDWVVQKATEKHREDRYQTALQLADELKRFQQDLPVMAGKSSIAYRMRKFYRRNRQLTLAVSAVFFVLLLGIIGSSAGLLRAQAAELRSKRLADKEATARALAEEAQEQEKVARMDAERRSKNLRTSAHMLHTIIEGMNPDFARADAAGLRGAVLEKLKWAGSEIITADVAEGDDLLVLKGSLAKALLAFGEYELGVSLWENIVENVSKSLPEDSVDLMVAQLNLSVAYRDARRGEEAVKWARRAKGLAEKFHADKLELVLFSSNVVAAAEEVLGNYEAAVEVKRSVKEKLEKAGFGATPIWADCAGTLVVSLGTLNRCEEALAVGEELLGYFDKANVLETDPQRLNLQQNMAMCLKRAGRLEEAWTALDAVAQTIREQFPLESPERQKLEFNVAVMMAVQPGKEAEARQALERVAKQDEPRLAFHAKFEICLLDFKSNDKVAAYAAAQEVADQAGEFFGDDHPTTKEIDEKVAELAAKLEAE